VASVAGAGSFLPLPAATDAVPDEYLRTHPTHEHRCACVAALLMLARSVAFLKLLFRSVFVIMAM
jgi:hypothetical protein